MKSSSDTRKPYAGLIRSLVLALDVGTTFSGVSYAILEPGEIPKIHGVTRFPGQEHVAGNSKIPTIMYYDSEGKMMAAGAEADTPSILSLAEDEGWIKVELFKLRLRPRTMKLNMNGMRLGPLPYRKSAVDVFGDFLSYLFLCTRNFIRDTHANGASLWRAVEHDIQFVLSHPNGWEGAQQTKMRRAAVYGGLIPGTNEDDVLSGSPKSGFLVLDAGGGTLDISSYAIRAQAPLVIEEVAPPDCVFAGSVFVSRRARELFQEKLKNSKYGTPDAVDHITKRFDETTKRLFRDKRDPQFISFGSPLDKDLSVGIRSGQLKLSGAEVAELFEPSVKAAVHAIKAQIEASSGMIKSVFLVGGYANSAWLFSQLQERLEPYRVAVSRPDTQTSKAVADGAIGFYCDHHVSARMSKFMYGVEYLRQYDSADPDHVERKDRLCELPSGPRLLPDAFDCILARGVKVKESTVFTRKYCTELTSLSLLSVFEVEIWCYRGGNTIPKWIMRQAEDFSTLCLVRADLSPLSSSAEAKTGKHGRVYWNIVFSVEIHFGLTEFKARIKWVDNGVTKYGPASIIYNERGHRLDEDEPDSYPEDDMTPAQSRTNRSLPGSRAHSVDATSFHTPAMSTVNSKRSSMLGPARNEPPPVPSVIPEVVPATPSIRSTTSVRSSRLPSLSRTPTENGTRVDPSRDQSRGRSAVSRGKERAITSPPIDESSSTTSTSNRNSSSRLADTLSSVWGVVSPTARSIAESLKSKEATPLSSPVKRELREILHAPPPPPDPIPSTAEEEAPMSAADMPGAFENGVSVGEVEQSQTEPAPVVESFSEAAAWGSFTSAGEATGANMGPTNLRISTALSNRAPSAVISPITLPEMNVDRSTQPIAEAGMLSSSNEPLLNSNEYSDLLSPPESAPSSTHNLAELLKTATPGLKSPTNATSPVSTSSKNTWSTKASPKPSSSPNATNPTTPTTEVQATASKSPWGTPKPAATPKAASKASSKNPSKAATPLASTPKPAATPQVATPIPASSPKVETTELPPTTFEQQVESAVAESHPSQDEIAAPDTTTQKTETHIENAASEPAGEPAADTAAPVPTDEATPAEAASAEAPTALTAAETPAEPEASAEIPKTPDASKEEIGDETMVAATPNESAPGTAPGTPGDGLNGADIEGRGEEGDEKEAKEEDEQATTPGSKKKKKKKKTK
ncbi:hypothetical protein F5050DRAFT_1809766 [Lentinula boryana]|uniref:Uncharacterized protein n=1 Tax=Lentinula boryana TaxID=40481 RepID=A0ABQ8Q701_9AGAR|nr:hypothetical protein F5050DRAFT_1809766 [Lentinula boryana]